MALLLHFSCRRPSSLTAAASSISLRACRLRLEHLNRNRHCLGSTRTTNKARCYSATADDGNSNTNMSTPGIFLDNLSSLAGTWQGQGQVLNASGETVATYMEQATFEILRQTNTAVVYRHLQKTRHATANKPMHAETGFLKLDSTADKTATASFAHPFPSGFVQEMSHGTWKYNNNDDANASSCLQITLDAQDFQRAATSAATSDKKQVQGFRRVYTLMGDGTLSYKQYLSTTAGGDNLYHHLTCSMKRDS